MLIRCPTCASAYDLAPELLPAGRTLRCAHCRDAWVHTVGAAEAPAGRSWPDGPEIVTEAHFFRQGDVPAAPPAAPRARVPHFWPRPSAGAAAGLVLAMLLGSSWAAVAGRARLVAAFPPSEAVFAVLGLPVNLRGLTLVAVRSTVEAADSRAVLTLQGRITNLRAASTAVPALRIAVRDKARRELYHWTMAAPKAQLTAGETVLFQSRLAFPPADGHDLAVSFADTAAEPRRVAELLPGDR